MRPSRRQAKERAHACMQAQPLTFSWGGAPVADTMSKAVFRMRHGENKDENKATPVMLYHGVGGDGGHRRERVPALTLSWGRTPMADAVIKARLRRCSGRPYAAPPGPQEAQG
jgi:hypothetical protein